MNDLLRYSVQPDGGLQVETPCAIGWQTMVDGETGQPLDLRWEMMAAGDKHGAQRVWDRLFSAGRAFAGRA